MLYSYAQKDWNDVVERIDFTNVKRVVDIGGGFGFLAKAINAKYSNIECFVVEKREVIVSTSNFSSLRDSPGSVTFVEGNLFYGGYPSGDLCIIFIFNYYKKIKPVILLLW